MYSASNVRDETRLYKADLFFQFIRRKPKTCLSALGFEIGGLSLRRFGTSVDRAECQIFPRDVNKTSDIGAV